MEFKPNIHKQLFIDKCDKMVLSFKDGSNIVINTGLLNFKLISDRTDTDEFEAEIIGLDMNLFSRRNSKNKIINIKLIGSRAIACPCDNLDKDQFNYVFNIPCEMTIEQIWYNVDLSDVGTQTTILRLRGIVY